MDSLLPDCFLHGTRWVRGDFHLHTRQDKEFQSSVGPNDFIEAYASRLEHEDVRVGVVTNHNKFDAEEFKALRKCARKRDIFLLPGVELSVRSILVRPSTDKTVNYPNPKNQNYE
ncbi:MAG TPA: hypothetical protein DCO65_02970 [Spartobacteria bacterium]|jgi:predicted metal-dependent phosphoesterase TrpH|nr:hypothetical protein [Spartobacteria bacterium]